MSMFPCLFADGAWHEIGELKTWETALLRERRENSSFSSDVGRAIGAHSRDKGIRNKELLPLKLFAKHQGILDRAKFRLMPEGHPTDMEIWIDDSITKLQITIALSCWHPGSIAGYQYALQNEVVDPDDVVAPAAHYYRDRDGTVRHDEGAPSEEERLRACRIGMEIAIRNKKKQAGKGIILIVYAKDYVEWVDDPNEFAQFARAALVNVGFPSFDRVCILSEVEGWFVEYFPGDFGAGASASA